ncbi:MAG: hypothetical protein KJ851_03690 [Nanoarchaeota archaeon]|nr:hypothetical protein [Nanoarchaeota archaeon]
MLLLAAQPSFAEVTAPTMPPHQFWGIATINGVPAPVGTSITATIYGDLAGSAKTTSGGAYNLIVENPNNQGDTILIFVNTVQAASDIFANGKSTNLDLAITVNVPPVVTAMISPSSATLNDSLNCTYTYFDVNSDTMSAHWFQWYVNDLLKPITGQILGVGNYSLNDQVICSIRAYDGTYNSTWVNSSTVTISDTIAPVLHNDSISALSGNTNNPFTVYVNATEANNMDWVKLELQDPNQVKTNYTLAQVSHIGNEYYYSVSVTPSIAGGYKFTYYSRDGSGNMNSLISNLTYIASTPPGEGSGSSGSGGSSGGSIQTTSTNNTKIIPPTNNSVSSSSLTTSSGLCNERWTCNAWSECTGGIQKRSCTDANKCGSIEDLPLTTQPCEIILTSADASDDSASKSSGLSGITGRMFAFASGSTLSIIGLIVLVGLGAYFFKRKPAAKKR